LSWIYSLVRPLKELNIPFVSYTANVDYALGFTAETNVLEQFLNEQFDPLGFGIFITNIDDIDHQFIFTKAENKPPEYIFNKSEMEPPYYLLTKNELNQSIKFIINVPLAVVFDPIIMRERVDFYNTAGKNYSIITF
jgi:hypothetical protein